jgi:phosphoribosylformimino-5-aminoimidazole carboxamide ribotide isomerase
MLVIPAIDLIHGECVRLKQGARSSKKVYHSNPPDVAREWEQAGASWIHVVNLDGAFGQANANVRAISSIVEQTKCNIELGGGVRSLQDVEKWLGIGIRRVILGTVAVLHPDIVTQALHTFGPESVIVGVDAKNEKIAIKGWEEESARELLPFIAELENMGVQRIIYTDISRDGEQEGPNLERLSAIAAAGRMQVIASGGFSKWSHFESLQQLPAANIEGAIVGTALYENELALRDLINTFERK